MCDKLVSEQSIMYQIFNHNPRKYKTISILYMLCYKKNSICVHRLYTYTVHDNIIQGYA